MTFLFNLIISKAAPVSYLKDLSEKRMRKSAKKKPCKTPSFCQSTLAFQMSVVSNWENDNILPSIEMLVKIANFFEVSTDYLLGLDKKRTLDVENLTEIQISHIQLIVDDLRNAK